MTSTNVVLYHAWSCGSRKVRLCLAEKGLDYESRSVASHSDGTGNPGGIVPCLFGTGGHLINEFLDEWALAAVDARRAIDHAKYVDNVCLPAVQKPNWSRSMQPVAQKWSDEELSDRAGARCVARDPCRWGTRRSSDTPD